LDQAGNEVGRAAGRNDQRGFVALGMQAIDVTCRGVGIIKNHAGFRVLITGGGSRVRGEQAAVVRVEDRFCDGRKGIEQVNEPPGGRGRDQPKLMRARERLFLRGYLDFPGAAKEAPANAIGESFPWTQGKWG
jgi:hypothetical protein